MNQAGTPRSLKAQLDAHNQTWDAPDSDCPHGGLYLHQACYRESDESVVLSIEEETPPSTKHRAPHGFSTEDISALFVAEGGIKLGMGISSSW